MKPLKKNSAIKVIGKAKHPKLKLPKPKSAKSRKNISKKVQNGTILQTRDEYFEGAVNYRKAGYQNKGLYRKATVIDSNWRDELVIVKGTTKGKPLNSTIFLSYKPFVETKDDTGSPIKIGKRFVPTKHILPVNIITQIKIDCYNNPCTKKVNKLKTRAVKGR